MDYNQITGNLNVEFNNMPPEAFFLGLLSAFDNRFQVSADAFFSEITWKQFFAIICINLCREEPTINELAEIMGSSHQNVKQILLKLEKKGFVKMVTDSKDKRKQRIQITEKCSQYCNSHEEESQLRIRQLFNGISEEQIKQTIGVISQMEKNLRLY